MQVSNDSVMTVHRVTGISIGISLLLILLGLLTLILPEAVSIAVAILVLWIIVLTGIAHLVHAWDARCTNEFLWRLLVGLAYISVGIFLMLHPQESLAALTLVLASLFVMEAVLMLAAFVWLRKSPGSSWLLINALLAGIIGLLIGFSWPSSSAWAIGVLVGVNILFSGFTRLMMSWMAHRVLRFIP